jgi:hypothetical protein
MVMVVDDEEMEVVVGEGDRDGQCRRHRRAGGRRQWWRWVKETEKVSAEMMPHAEFKRQFDADSFYSTQNI